MSGKMKRILRKRGLLIVALLLGLSLVAAIPTYAWFAHSRMIAELQAVKSPNQLFISGAYAEDVICFEIPVINVQESGVTSQLFPFAVAGEYSDYFTLQLAHTTNVPFTYTIYEAEASETPPSGEYVPYVVGEKWVEFADLTFAQRVKSDNSSLQGQTVYLSKGNSLSESPFNGAYLNATTAPDDGRLIATDKYHEETFGEYSKTHVQKYAEPLYWQCSRIKSVENSQQWGAKPFFKTFLLEISWEGKNLSNAKETDIIYISVFRE